MRFGFRLRAQFQRSEYLGAQIWTRGNQEPNFRVGIRRERNLRLRARTTAQHALAEAAAIRAAAIPLRKAAPSRGAEDLNAHDHGGGARQPAPQSEVINRKEPASDSGLYKGLFDRLKFGVGVRADFAVQIDFFVLRGDPFHERGSLGAFNAR